MKRSIVEDDEEDEEQKKEDNPLAKTPFSVVLVKRSKSRK